MAFTFKFNNASMDMIMSTVRKYDVNPSEAVDMLLAELELIKETNDGSRESAKN